LKEEAQDRTLWRTFFGKGYGPVLRQTAELVSFILKQILVVQEGTVDVNSTRSSSWFASCAKSKNDFRVALLPFTCVKNSVEIAARMLRQIQHL
jgi:hypothetical protein